MDSDNRFGKCCKCPARMSDGRIFTNWTPRKRLNEFLRTQNKIESAHEYRKFLQDNANSIIKKDSAYLEQTNKCVFK